MAAKIALKQFLNTGEINWELKQSAEQKTSGRLRQLTRLKINFG